MKAFEDGGWDLDCTMEVSMRYSFVDRLTFKKIEDEQMKYKIRRDVNDGRSP